MHTLHWKQSLHAQFPGTRCDGIAKQTKIIQTMKQVQVMTLAVLLRGEAAV